MNNIQGYDYNNYKFCIYGAPLRVDGNNKSEVMYPDRLRLWLKFFTTTGYDVVDIENTPIDIDFKGLSTQEKYDKLTKLLSKNRIFVCNGKMFLAMKSTIPAPSYSINSNMQESVNVVYTVAQIFFTPTATNLVLLAILSWEEQDIIRFAEYLGPLARKIIDEICTQTGNGTPEQRYERKMQYIEELVIDSLDNTVGLDYKIKLMVSLLYQNCNMVLETVGKDTPFMDSSNLKKFMQDERDPIQYFEDQKAHLKYVIQHNIRFIEGNENNLWRENMSKVTVMRKPSKGSGAIYENYGIWNTLRFRIFDFYLGIVNIQFNEHEVIYKTPYYDTKINNDQRYTKKTNIFKEPQGVIVYESNKFVIKENIPLDDIVGKGDHYPDTVIEGINTNKVSISYHVLKWDPKINKYRITTFDETFVLNNLEDRELTHKQDDKEFEKLFETGHLNTDYQAFVIAPDLFSIGILMDMKNQEDATVLYTQDLSVDRNSEHSTWYTIRQVV
jgi:hypothetical protein